MSPHLAFIVTFGVVDWCILLRGDYTRLGHPLAEPPGTAGDLWVVFDGLFRCGVCQTCKGYIKHIIYIYIVIYLCVNIYIYTYIETPGFAAFVVLPNAFGAVP